MSKKPIATNARPAGPDHQVVTVEGGKAGVYRKTPCDGCPWKTANAGTFPAEAFRHSANTAYDMASHTFACHEVGYEKTTATCAGFLLRGADNNLAYRIAVIKGNIDPSKVTDGGHELFDDYRAMAEANGVDPEDPVLRPCR